MTRGVVAAGHRLTAEAAAGILAEGGNAFDAAIAAIAMATVAEPVLTSLGGGGFLMARRAGGETALYDFFVETPLRRRPDSEVSVEAILADFGPVTQEFHIGLGTTATPGQVPGLFAIHEALGSVPIARLFAPAIETARDGMRLTRFQTYLFDVVAPILSASESARAIFAPEGHLLREGDLLRNLGLAETFERLVEEGPSLFAEGEVGQAICAQCKEHGGHLTKEDLAAYRVVERDPLIWRHRGGALALNPPPAASGALIAYGLGVLEALDDERSDTLHLFRALAATNDARRRHGEGLADRLRGGALDDEFAQLAAHPPAYRGTTHISVIDAEGNAAAVSLSNGEGNGHMVGNHGFMLNNMLGEEDLSPDGVGRWREGVRLSSMMAPTIISEADGTVTALGTGGSNRIRTAILQVALNLVEHGMDLETAVCAPRMHVEKSGKLSYEPGLDMGEALQEASEVHAWPERNLFFGGVHAARRHPDGSLEGAGDPRRGGDSVIV
ncbi:Gamma-glutamyltranspeptidase precursor [Methyloligella halotolerans]|uniref:Gamma-glutamyltranspeptidase n=1 Tax=Methyloligella halotolerans TaxID=1177755 RepID=A0A1E2RZW7_9HYPH|nr:gamma-glutamyltransferase [Methyloligella halotolerans]ODA67764.1 Gamma-glutamyltranspeptidase precursor [Methyloligella halotolerans]